MIIFDNSRRSQPGAVGESLSDVKDDAVHGAKTAKRAVKQAAKSVGRGALRMLAKLGKKAWRGLRGSTINSPFLKQNQKALRPSCQIDIQRIFGLLHAKAVIEANKLLQGVDGVVENTAAAGNDPENVVFHSAGEHMITARAKDKGGEIPRKDASAAIRKYVEIFCGKDVANDLEDDQIFPLPADGGAPVVTESSAFELTFTDYLAGCRGRKFLAEAEGEGSGGE